MESTSVQDYLKAIYRLGEGGAEVTTSAVAQRMRVQPASVTAMVKRLAAQGYLEYQRYRGVKLTDAGRALAREVIRHHRLLEAYLHKALGLEWDEVHAEAEVLEHALSEELEDRIDKMLGYPTHDPHGDPIPPKKGEIQEPLHPSLNETPVGPAKVERVSDRDPEALRYLASIGLRPGSVIQIREHAPFHGPVWITIGRKRHAIGSELAAGVHVSRAPQ